MEKLKVGMVGAGGRGMSHIRAMAAAPNIEFVAICDKDEDVGKPVAEEMVTAYVASIDQLLADVDVDAVGICVPTPHHYETAMQVIEADKHLLTEKPMASSISQAREMMEEAESRKLRAAISYQLRFDPVMLQMKEICEQIEPIQILFARQRGMMAEKYLTPEPFDGIMDFISHDIDMVPFWAGKEPKAVFATMGRDVWADAGAISYMGAQVEIGEGPHKCVGVISSSQGGGGIPQRLDIVGRTGIATAQGNEIRYAIGPNPMGRGESRDLWRASYGGEGHDYTMDLYEHFAACCLDAEKELAPAASYRDGYNALLVSLAMVESGESGDAIDLEQFAAAGG